MCVCVCVCVCVCGDTKDSSRPPTHLPTRPTSPPAHKAHRYADSRTHAPAHARTQSLTHSLTHSLAHLAACPFRTAIRCTCGWRTDWEKNTSVNWISRYNIAAYNKTTTNQPDTFRAVMAQERSLQQAYHLSPFLRRQSHGPVESAQPRRGAPALPAHHAR